MMAWQQVWQRLKNLQVRRNRSQVSFFTAHSARNLDYFRLICSPSLLPAPRPHLKAGHWDWAEVGVCGNFVSWSHAQFLLEIPCCTAQYESAGSYQGIPLCSPRSCCSVGNSTRAHFTMDWWILFWRISFQYPTLNTTESTGWFLTHAEAPAAWTQGLCCKASWEAWQAPSQTRSWEE